MFESTFNFYALRTVTFVVNGSTVGTQSFYDSYAVKTSTDSTPSTNPTIKVGDTIYPTYNAETRTINKPYSYSNYDWYRTDGTDCHATTPTLDCGEQNSSSLVSVPNTTEWVPTTSTEKGDVTLYGVLIPSISLTLDPANLAIGSAFNPILPSDSGTFANVSHTAKVITDNPTGYKMSLSTDLPSSNPNASDMYHRAQLGVYLSATANTCSWNDTTKVFTNTTNALSNNTWGFTLDSTNLTNQKLCKVPNSNSPLTVKSTTAKTTGDYTTIYYGVKVDRLQRVGYYRSTMVYTVVTNP
jgi:hypothetical protein